MADPKKVGTFGTVEVRVVEVRDVKVSYCTVKCEITQRQTAVKKKSELNAKFDEDFSLFVSPSLSLCLTSMHTRTHFSLVDILMISLFFFFS